MDRIEAIKTKMNRFFPAEVKKRYTETTDFKEKLSEEIKSNNVSKEKGAFDVHIDEASTKHKVPKELIAAIIKRESDFNPTAVSQKGAMGLMQLMPQTAKEVKVSDPFNPRDNILGGTHYFKQMLTKYDGDIVRALAAYNAGSQHVKDGKIPDFRETKNYIKNILDSYLKNTGVTK
jgi:soluble lytic murein transglycosylase-like protein